MALLVAGVVAVGVMAPLAWGRGVLSASQIAQAEAANKSIIQAATPSGPQPVILHRTAGQPLRVLLVGDSLTNGLYATAQGNGFAFQLAARLAKSGPVERQQAAVSGASAGHVAAVTDVPEHLDFALVELGTNDAGRTPIDQFTQQYGALLDRIRAKSPSAALVCLGTWGDAADYDARVQGACESHGGRFITLRDLYAKPSLRGPAGQQRFGGTSDDFHPNDAGHTAIADRVWGQLSVVSG